MKKIIITTIVLCFTISTYAQIAIGGGIGYNEKASSAGIIPIITQNNPYNLFLFRSYFNIK